MTRVAPFWSIASLVSGSSEPSDFQVSLEDMISHTGRLVDGEFSQYSADGTPFNRGDVLFGKLRPYLAKYWLADREGTAGGDIHVYRPESDIDPRYLTYIVGSRNFVRFAEAASKGVKMPRVEWMALREYPVVQHEPGTQKAIADYLDRETGEIDAMIAKMDELTKTLEGRRVQVMQNATQLKENGGRWDLVPTAHLFASIGSGTTPKGAHHYAESGSGIPWVTTAELRENTITTTFQDVTEHALSSVSSLRVHPSGAVIIAMYGATIGRLGVLGVDATMNQACCAFSRPRDVDPRFFYYTLWGQRDDIIREAAGGGQPNISQGMLRRWRVPHPPLAEQLRIADHLDEVTGKIDAMLAKAAELKLLLTERRAALITDVVTGRKKVV